MKLNKLHYTLIGLFSSLPVFLLMKLVFPKFFPILFAEGKTVLHWIALLAMVLGSVGAAVSAGSGRSDVLSGFLVSALAGIAAGALIGTVLRFLYWFFLETVAWGVVMGIGACICASAGRIATLKDSEGNRVDVYKSGNTYTFRSR